MFRRFLALFALVLLVILGACGGTPAASPATEVPSAPATAVVEPSPVPPAPTTEPTAEPTTEPTVDPVGATDTSGTDAADAADLSALEDLDLSDVDISGLLGGILGGGVGAGETVTNQLGYSLVVPEGWSVLMNVAFEGTGAVMMVPEGTDPMEGPDENVLAVNVGDSSVVFDDAALPPDASLDDLMSSFQNEMIEEDPDVKVSDVENVRIGGLPGRAVNITSSVPETNEEVFVRLGIARIDDARIVTVIGIATRELWDPAAVDAVFASLDLSGLQ
ncbi:hypothetical protein [Candidatus Chloroploca asiatica]|uniref:Uncharacterized protein n=1 Tax=Candidatus Chloroploca asiatica TaxID=1506545 RepID=A0A2H3L299_9CHLR|nr:hypothetical protein [Candidatus Chloroploca asiatica]PDW00633.1 hypothetical protein A9Q02_21640 [Candidatus Chloroploca asiatica]